jgi:hypothetical protein
MRVRFLQYVAKFKNLTQKWFAMKQRAHSTQFHDGSPQFIQASVHRRSTFRCKACVVCAVAAIPRFCITKFRRIAERKASRFLDSRRIKYFGASRLRFPLNRLKNHLTGNALYLVNKPAFAYLNEHCCYLQLTVTQQCAVSRSLLL